MAQEDGGKTSPDGIMRRNIARQDVPHEIITTEIHESDIIGIGNQELRQETLYEKRLHVFHKGGCWLGIHRSVLKE
jgi:hypothetical protein